MTWLIIVLTFFFILWGMPIAWALGLGSVLFLYFEQSLPIAGIAHKLFSELNSFTLMAVPFFVLMAYFMVGGRSAKRLIDLANSILKPIPGGLPISIVVAGAFFGAMCGSASSGALTFSIIAVPIMVALGYDKVFPAALCAATGLLSVIIPPSLGFIFYGAITGESIGKLFLAGVIPGIILTIGMSIVCSFLSQMRHYPRDETPFSLRETAKSFWGSLGPLGLPVIVLGGMYGGMFTPTEAAAVGAVYAALLGIFGERAIKYRDVLPILSKGMQTTAFCLIIVGTALLFGFALCLEQIPQMMLKAIEAAGLSRIGFLMVLNVFLLILGCFLDGPAIMIILTPLLYPIITSMGIDPIQFGVIMTLNVAIGQITPPIGLNLFVVSGVTGIPPEKIARGLLPFLGVFVIVLILVTYFPSISVWLPNILQ